MIDKNATINFTIDSIRNPPNLGNNYTIGIQTLFPTGDVIDICSYNLNDMFTPGIVMNFTVNPQSYGFG